MITRFPVFDSDSHVVEPPAVWEKYLTPEYRTLGRHALWRQEGATTSYLKINGETFRDTMNPSLPRHALWRPGMTGTRSLADATVRHPNRGPSDPTASREGTRWGSTDAALIDRVRRGVHSSTTPTRVCPGGAYTLIADLARPAGPGCPRRMVRCRP